MDSKTCDRCDIRTEQYLEIEARNEAEIGFVLCDECCRKYLEFSLSTGDINRIHIYEYITETRP